MTKIVISLFLGLLLIGCNSPSESIDYFGQTYPESNPVIFAPDIISVKGRLEHGISFTPDTRELAFGILNQDDLSGQIFYSRKIEDKWPDPMVFEPLKNECVYLPYFSPDGKSLLYTQSKADTDNVFTDIWMMKKMDDIWVFPKLLKAPLNSSSRESNACMTYSGVIYFCSNRNCIGKLDCHSADLFYSNPNDREYQSVDVIPEFISPNDEESVFISPKEDYIIFCRYTDNETGVDLYISYRDSEKSWTEPKLVDSTINSRDWDRRPFVSIDNKYLFFTRLQIGEKGLTESDIFWVNTSKMFKPFVYRSLSNIIVQAGTEFEINIPNDYFKDIDDKDLIYNVKQNQFEWLNFDSVHMKLSGLPSVEGDFELTFTAIDKSSNVAEDKIILTVKK